MALARSYAIVSCYRIVQDLPGGGIKNGTSVEVEDYSQDLSVKLIVFQKTFDEEEVRYSYLSYFLKYRPILSVVKCSLYIDC